MDYLQDLISDNLGPEYIPSLPVIPKVDIPVYQDVQDAGAHQPVMDADPFADLRAVAQRPASEGQLSVQRFEGDITRFKSSPNYNIFGYDPNLQQVKIDDKTYDPNEIRYQHAQTWGDVLSNAMGQFSGLAWNSFKNTAKSDGRFIDALFNSDSWTQFKENVIGSSEELLAADQEQKRIMNTNPIFESPTTQGIFNKEFLGSSVGQLGFTVGTGVYVAAETLLSGGILDGVTAAARGKDLVRLGKAVEGLGSSAEAMTVAQNAKRTGDIGKAITELTKLGDVAKDRSTMESIWNGMKNIIPGYQAANDVRLAAKAGATFGEAVSAGLPGLIKSYTMFNAARAEASMEAASTYGQLYMGLLRDYEQKHGIPATGNELQRIKDMAYGAATDNFIANTGMLMAFNEIEFGAMMSKFSSSRRLFREAAEAAGSAEGKAMYTVEGTAKRDIGEGIKAGEEATQVYKPGKFGAMGLFPTIRRDFGLGTALWQVAKQWGKGAGKLEIAEGIQEILQETSNTTISDYYKNLYNGNKDINGTELLNITAGDWEKGLGQQMNADGWKTFLMGATTGLFLSPISAMTMYGRHKGQMAISQQYKDTYNEQQNIIDDNIQILNQFYSNPKTALNDHMASGKVATQAVKGMKESLPTGSPYMFYNHQDDVLAKAAATAVKTGTIEPFLNRLKAMGDGRLTDQELREALNLPDTGTDTDPKLLLNQVIRGVEQYYTNYQNLKDRFGDLIIPSIYSDPRQRGAAMIKKKALDEAIEIIATFGYHGTKTVERALEIKGELSKLGTISSASNRAFELLANKQALQEEVKQRKEVLKTLQGLNDSDSKELAKQEQAIINSLTHWDKGYDEYQRMTKATKEEYETPGFTEAFNMLEGNLMNQFKDYIRQYNEISKITVPIDEEDVRKAFRNMGDYIALMRDHRQYVEALNILTDPHNLTILHKKITDGITNAVVDNKIAAEDEVKDRAKAIASTPEQTIQEPTSKESTSVAPTEPAAKPEPQAPREHNLTIAAKDIIDYYGQLQDEDVQPTDAAEAFLEDYKDVRRDINKVRRRVTEKIKIEGDITPATEKELLDDVTDVIQKKVDELTPKPVEETPVAPVEPVVYTKLPFYSIFKDAGALYTPESMKGAADNAVRNIPVGDMGMLDPDSISMVISRNLYDIREVQGQYEVYQTVTGRIVSTHPTIEEAQAALSTKQSPYSYQNNPNVQVNREAHEIAIYSGGTLIGYIPNPNKYTFIIDGKPTNLPASADDLQKVVDTGTMSKDDAYQKWVAEYNKLQTLANDIQKAVGAQDRAVVTGTELDNILKVYRKLAEYDYMNENRIDRPTLQDMVDTGSNLLAVTTKDGGIAIDNTEGVPTIPEPQNITSQYRALIEKDGQQHWIELSPAVVTDSDLSILSGDLQRMLHEANNLEYGSKEREDIKKQMDSILDTFITTKPGATINYIELKAGNFPDGVKLWLKVNPRTLPKSVKPFSINIVTKGKIDNSFLTAENKVQALVDAINSADAKFQEWAKKNGVQLNGEHIAIDKSSLRFQSPKNPEVIDIMGMQSGVGLSVAKSYIVGYTPNDSSIPQEVVPTIPTVVEKAPIDGGGKATEPVDVVAPTSIGDIERKRKQEIENTKNQSVTQSTIIKGARVILKSFSSGVEPREVVISTVSQYGFKVEGHDKWYNFKNGLWNRVTNLSEQDRINTKYDKEIAELNKQIPISIVPETASYAAKEQAIVDAVAENAATEEDEWNMLRQQPTSAKKVITPREPFTTNSIVNIDTLNQWVRDRLPADIVVEDLGILTDNLLAQNITVGQFLTDLKTIQIYRDSPFKYHEAFHAIFRLLLPQDRIDHLLSQAAKEHPVTPEALQKMRNLHPDYMAMGDKELTERYYEEYMADKFDAWMLNKGVRTSSTIKGFFAKVLDWIKEVFNRLTGRDIQALFYEVNRGKYQNARLQDNQFTEGVSQPAMKVIQVGTDVVTGSNGQSMTVPRYLPQQKGEQLASTVAALYHQMVKTEPQQTKNQLLDKILDMYREMLSPDNQTIRDKASTITDKKERIQWKKRLVDTHQVFVGKDSREAIKEAVDEHLQLMGYRQEMDESMWESDENNNGERTTANYNKEADMFGGYMSLSTILREYVGSTTAPYEDEFGNTHFIDGTPLVEAVPAAHVYNGMMKVLSNSSDDNQLIDKMLVYLESGSNKATQTFIQRVLSETGFDRDASGKWIVPKNPLLLQSVIKGFNNYDTNPIFIEMVPQGGVKGYNVNRQDSAKVQFDEWAQANDTVFMSQYDQKRGKEQILKEPKKVLKDLQNKLAATQKDKKIDDNILRNDSLDIANKIYTTLGIKLSPNYIAYSIVSTRDNRTDYQQRLVNANRDVYPILYDDIAGIVVSLEKDGNIFITKEGEDMTGATTRLMKIAAGNAYFDETVDSMTYKGPDGETHYSSQAPNYQMIRTQEFNRKQGDKLVVIDQLQQSPDHNNFLLDENSEFRKMADLGIIKTQHIAGLKVREGAIDAEEQGDNQDVGVQKESNKGEGVAYKSFNEREMNVFMVSSYGIQNSKVVYGAGKNDMFYTAPHLITVIEAKSTGHIARLPINTAVQTNSKGTTLTKDTLDKLYRWVEQEYAMIKATKVAIDAGDTTISGYNKGAERGLKLYNTKLWFTPEYRQSIEEGALNPEYTLNEAEVKEQLQQHFQQDIREYINYLSDQGIVSVTGEGIQNNLLPEFTVQGFKDSDRDSATNMISGNLYHNLAQIYMNDMLNTTAIRQLLYGNEAKAFKDNIDRIKRMGGGAASGRSAAFSYTAPELGIDHEFTTFHHVTYKSTQYNKMNGGKGDKDDAQMWCTEKGYRYLLFGFGKLTQQQADILDKMKRGESVTKKEFFGAGGLKERNGAFSSMKVVYYDTNNVYLKCSLFPLTKEYTSYKENGVWKALPYMKELHDLREKLEEYENRNSTVVYAGPDTHSKGLKEYVAGSVAGIRDEHYRPLESKWMRLQMENPSNKTSLTVGTQSKQQIMSEQPEGMKPVVEQYMRDSAQKTTNDYNTAINSVFSLDEGLIELDKSIAANQVTPKLGEFFKIMKETLEATGSDQQTLDFLDVQNGEPVYDPNFPAILPKYTQIFMSYFSKVMSEKAPGVTLALVSDYGTQRVKEVLEIGEDGQPKRWRVVPDRDYKKNPSRYNSAKRWSDKENRLFSGLKKGDYIIDDLRHNVPEYDKAGNIVGRFSEYIRPAHWPEEMNGIVGALSKGFGIRIPSDDKHSYIALRMVDDMPVALGSVGVFPQELLEISGADFDIDKIFIQLQDTYLKQVDSNMGQPVYGRVAYGQSDNINEQFEEYIIWQAANNRVVKDRIKDIIGTDEGAIATILQDHKQIVLTALEELGLPHTVQQYKELKKKGEPNNGVLNNTILAAKIELLNNEAISGGGNKAIINQATSTDPLTNLAKELVELGVIPEETDVDINTLRGKGISYINNKEGQRNIGAAINAMLAFSVLEQYGIGIEGDKLEYNGKLYKTFSGSVTDDGARKFAQISAIVNAMTDNAKERLAAKLGLNIQAVGYVTTMIAQGIPLKDTVLYMLQPSIRNYFRKLVRLDGVIKTEQEKKTAKKNLLDNMIDQYTKLAKSQYPDKETAELLATTLDGDKLINNISTNGEDTRLQLAALRDLRTIRKQADTLRTLSSIMKLNQGLDVTWEGTDRTIEQLAELGVVDGKPAELPEGSPIDVRDILTEKHPIFSTYIRILGQVNELSKKIFIERTPLFQDMTATVEANMQVPNTEEGREWKKTLKNDLISYLSIRSYIHWLKQNGYSTETLDHAMIYDSAKSNKAPEYRNIVDMVKNIREKTPGNYLVDKFLRYVQAGEESNKDNINKAESNTWAKLSENQQQKLYDSFITLYTNPETHQDAVALFNYLLVKDGGQFKSGSFIKYIPPFAFKDLLDRTGEINKMLASGKETEEQYIQMFGGTKGQIMSEFMMSYGTHISNRYMLKQVEPMGTVAPNLDELEGLGAEDIKRANTYRAPIVHIGDRMNVNIFQGIRKEGQKGKFSKVEGIMLAKNIEALADSGLTVTKVDEKNLVMFPATISHIVREEIEGEDDMYQKGAIKYSELFVLKSVDGKEPVLEGDNKMAQGTYGVYEKQPYRGSKGQWKGAGVFGDIPLPTVTTKKGDIDGATVSPSSPAKPLAEKENVQLPEQPTIRPVDTNSPVMQQLAAYGINIARDSRGSMTITKDGQPYPVAPGTTPRMLLEQLSGTRTTEQAVVPSQISEEVIDNGLKECGLI